jgi:glycosyltransferase involved in cell wall biosynthesis
MKILFLNYEYPPLGGGAGNASSYILREFAKIPDLEIDFVTSSVDKFRTEKVGDNITIHFLDINKKGNFHFQSMKDLLVYSWKAYWYSKKLMKKNKYDLCHAFFGIPCGYIAMKLRIPYIVSLRGSDIPFYNNRFYFLDKFVFKKLSKKIWKKAKAVVALSHDSIELARKTSKKQSISVIYNGINIKEFYPDQEILQKEKTFNILFVGRLIERKGAIYLLKAFRKISSKYSEARLLIAGGGPLKDTFQNFAKENNLEGKIKFYGIVKHDEIADLYRKSHIFVLPSLNEALGNVTQEALASGLPIITTKTGAAELIDTNGLIIEKGNSQDIKEKLTQVIENKDLREKMSQRSRQLAENMSWENTAKKYFDLYKKCLE